nr:SGNH/GDSL hydrolase family protein [uncultured Blautia sp.]
MNRIENWKETIEELGRIVTTEEGIPYLGWTNSGMRFSYTGSCLMAELEPICAVEGEDGRKTWPYLAVFYDDRTEPEFIFEVKDSKRAYLIFGSETSETHRITIRKVTENLKGKIGVKGFLGDGGIKKVPGTKKIQIEFIGDSITCGFGNMTDDRDRAFYAADENGWMSHAAVAGRILEAEVHMISCSGISLTAGIDKKSWDFQDMSTIYPYTDCLLQQYFGDEEMVPWDFASHPSDVIVVNLGTNDAAAINLCGDIRKGTDLFENEYYDFLELLRKKNGKDSWIICALGPLDYYLYDIIEKAANRYAEDKDDNKIRCFKYMKVRAGEGYGACSHPSLATQKRMGQEIAEYIRTLTGGNYGFR